LCTRPELRPELHPRGNRRAPYYSEVARKTKRLRCLDRGLISGGSRFRSSAAPSTPGQHAEIGQTRAQRAKASGFGYCWGPGHVHSAGICPNRRIEIVVQRDRNASLRQSPLYRFETIGQKAAASSWHWFLLIQLTQTSAEPATRQTMPARFCCFGLERIRCYSIVQGFKFAAPLKIFADLGYRDFSI
jgi:hypothetical protein